MSKRETMVREELAGLYQQHGTLTPDLVVRVASNPKSPLHAFFEWDNTAAATAWRLAQARDLIRSVRVEIRTTTSVIDSVAYVRNPDAEPRDQGYVSVESLRADAVAAQNALRYEVQRAIGGLNRARHLALALGLEGEVDKIVTDMEALVETAA